MSNLPVDPGYENILPRNALSSPTTGNPRKRNRSEANNLKDAVKRFNKDFSSTNSASAITGWYNRPLSTPLQQAVNASGRAGMLAEKGAFPQPAEKSPSQMFAYHDQHVEMPSSYRPPRPESPDPYQNPYPAYDQHQITSRSPFFGSNFREHTDSHNSVLDYPNTKSLQDSKFPPHQVPAFRQQPGTPSRYPCKPQGTQHYPLEISSSPEPVPQDALPDRYSPKDELNTRDIASTARVSQLGSNDPSADVVPIAEPVLCQEQAELVEVILSGRNVFYTGSAGCGKSTVLKAFVKRFAEMGLKVNIVAPTGRAALDINGSTTWTYAGWTPDSHKKPLKELRKNAHGKFVSQRLKDTDVLVIDEISMVENLHFERLNVIMKEARGSDQAFGGVQLVVTGDFCQLPPVKPFGHCIECGRELIRNREETEYKCRMHGVYYDIDKWAFRSSAWKECNFVHVNLTNIHRQSDEKFIKILQKLRMGNVLLPADTAILLDHPHQTRNAVKLFSTREEVKRVNDEMFGKLRTMARTYKCLDHFRWNEKHRNLESKKNTAIDGSLVALREHRYESQIQLKKGMVVVLLHNLDIQSGLVNGSQGTIQGFEDYDPARMPKSASSRNNPTTKSGTEVESTGPTLAGDYATFREEQLKAFIKNAEFKKWPIVRFLNGVERTIFADCTVNELGDEQPYSILARTQIPLMAAWAMTTHKSQGMTLNRVIVDLGKAFEEGQAYVALSRARSLEGLQVMSLPSPSRMGTGNPQVREFLREKFNI